MKGIIFDMDGVLVDAMPFHAEAMRQYLPMMKRIKYSKIQSLRVAFCLVGSAIIIKQLCN